MVRTSTQLGYSLGHVSWVLIVAAAQSTSAYRHYAVAQPMGPGGSIRGWHQGVTGFGELLDVPMAGAFAAARQIREGSLSTAWRPRHLTPN